MKSEVRNLIESLDEPLQYERYEGALPSYVYDEWRFTVNGAIHVLRFLNGKVNGKRTLIISFGKRQGNNVVKKYDGITNIRQYLATVLAIFNDAVENPTKKMMNKLDGFDLMFTPGLWEKVEKRFERMFKYKMNKRYAFSPDYHVSNHNDASVSFYFWKRSRTFKTVFTEIDANPSSDENMEVTEPVITTKDAVEIIKTQLKPVNKPRLKPTTVQAYKKPFVKVEPIELIKDVLDTEPLTVEMNDRGVVTDMSVDYSEDVEYRKELATYFTAKYGDILSEDDVNRGKIIVENGGEEYEKLMLSLTRKLIIIYRDLTPHWAFNPDDPDEVETIFTNPRNIFTEDELAVYDYFAKNTSKSFGTQVLVGLENYNSPSVESVRSEMRKLDSLIWSSHKDGFADQKASGHTKEFDAKLAFDAIEKLYKKSDFTMSFFTVNLSDYAAFYKSPINIAKFNRSAEDLQKVLDRLHSDDPGSDWLSSYSLTSMYDVLDVDDTFRLAKAVPPDRRLTIFMGSDYEIISSFVSTWFSTTGSTSQVIGSKVYNDSGINAEIGNFWSYIDSDDKNIQGMISLDVKMTNKCLHPVRDKIKGIMDDVYNLTQLNLPVVHKEEIADDFVDLYRGIRKKREDFEFYSPGALESWTTHREVASGFSGKYGTVLTTRVPTTAIFLTNQIASEVMGNTVAGEYEREKEWVLMGGALKTYPVYATNPLDDEDTRAIKISSMTEWLITEAEGNKFAEGEVKIKLKDDADFKEEFSKIEFGNSLEELLGKPKKVVRK